MQGPVPENRIPQIPGLEKDRNSVVAGRLRSVLDRNVRGFKAGGIVTGFGVRHGEGWSGRLTFLMRGHVIEFLLIDFVSSQ